MDLMTLAAKIELDDSSFTKGVSNAEKMGQQLSGKMSAWTVAVGNLAADMVREGIDAIQGIIGGAMDGYADYQQLVGGVETLFKTSATKVQNYAKQSFKTTGLSANQYMETVTSFSASLLQGLGGDTEAAADMANMAITDMADNANKMGTDISSIQAAYQGFAKQNYTMLDNLKLGYGGTASEMVRLINDSKILDHEIDNLDDVSFDQIVQALHVVQTEMGITGTTAKEAAETISGSKASLASAWSDLLVAVTGTDQSKTDWWNDPLNESVKNFQESFSTYIENIVPALVQTVGNSGKLVTAIADAIADLPTDLLSQISEEGLEAGTEMIGATGKITHWLIESIANMFTSAKNNPQDVQQFGEAIGEFLGSTISDLITYAPSILESMITVGANLAGGLIEGLFEGLFGKDAEVDKITEQLQEDLTDIDLNNAKATGILKYMDQLYEKYGNGVKRTAEWKEAQQQLEEILPAAGKVFQDYGSDIQGAIDTLEKLNESMRRTAIENALHKAIAEENALLTTQTFEYNKQVAAARRNASLIETYGAPLREAVLERAEEKRMSIQERQANGEFVGADEIQMVQNILSGFAEVGGELKDLGSLDLGQLQGLLKDLYNGALPTELDFTEYVDKYTPLMAEAQREMEEAITKAGEWQAEIDATNQAMTDSRDALEMTVEALLGDSKKIETSGTGTSDALDVVTYEIGSSGTSLVSAISGLAARVANISFGGTPGAFAAAVQGGLAGIFMPRAVGIDNVPTDHFYTELHKGEAVLTRSENEKRHNGGGDALVGAVQELRNDLQNLRLVIGRREFGRTVVDYSGSRISDYIGEADTSAQAGYGA